MRAFPFCLVLAAALAAPVPARGDEIVLDNGRKLSGRVVAEDEKTVKIETSTGTLTFDRGRVKEIRKSAAPPPKADPPRPADAPPAAPPPGPGAAAKKAFTPAPWTPTGHPSRARAKTVKDQIEELRATRLVPWPDHTTVAAKDVEPGKSWRVVRTDGLVVQRADAPPGPAGIAQAWELRDPVGGRMMTWMNGQRVFEWRPMFWNTARAVWWANHEDFEAFQRYEAVTKSLLALVCARDLGGWVTCNSLVDEMGRKQGGSRVRKADVSIAPELAKIREAAAKCAGEPAAADVTRCFEIEHLMKWEGPEGQIRFAEERARLVIRLAATLR